MNSLHNTSLKDAVKFATARSEVTGEQQVVYQSQTDHYLWCSLSVWQNGQSKLTPRVERLVQS